MKKNQIVLCILFLLIVSCSETSHNSEKTIFIQKVDALSFLSNYHHQLHIMIGEEEGDGNIAYKEFSDAISNTTNPELYPVLTSFKKIKKFKTASDPVMHLDYLIDYYQSGLSLQVEAVLRGYGYFENFPIDSALSIYERLQIDS